MEESQRSAHPLFSPLSRDLKKEGVLFRSIDCRCRLWLVDSSMGVFLMVSLTMACCFCQLKRRGLRVQAVMSFHAAGNNVGDICHIPLPPFVLEVGRQNPDIFYRDREGRVNEECLSLGCDDEPLFSNNDTPIMKYQKFMMAFVQEFEELIGASRPACCSSLCSYLACLCCFVRED